MKAPLYLALLHHPVFDRRGDVVTTSITNMDVHDIARAAATFGVRRFYVVHGVPALRALAERIIEHWRSGYGSRYNPSRTEAIALVEIATDLEAAITAAEKDSGQMPYLVATSARSHAGALTFEALGTRLAGDSRPCMLVLGTGYGLAAEAMARVDAILEPIAGTGPYNHLSVRSAAAILLDRLVGASRARA